MNRLSLHPTAGAVLAALVYFFARLGADVLFRYRLPQYPLPPLWSLLLPQTLGTIVVASLVLALLGSIRKQHEAIVELNHELRNALQVISYALPTCAPDVQPQSKEAVERIACTMRRVTLELTGGIKAS